MAGKESPPKVGRPCGQPQICSRLYRVTKLQSRHAIQSQPRAFENKKRVDCNRNLDTARAIWTTVDFWTNRRKLIWPSVQISCNRSIQGSHFVWFAISFRTPGSIRACSRRPRQAFAKAVWTHCLDADSVSPSPRLRLFDLAC